VIRILFVEEVDSVHLCIFRNNAMLSAWHYIQHVHSITASVKAATWNWLQIKVRLLKRCPSATRLGVGLLICYHKKLLCYQMQPIQNPWNLMGSFTFCRWTGSGQVQWRSVVLKFPVVCYGIALSYRRIYMFGESSFLAHFIYFTRKDDHVQAHVSLNDSCMYQLTDLNETRYEHHATTCHTTYLL
jgi:hypothetical protein